MCIVYTVLFSVHRLTWIKVANNLALKLTNKSFRGNRWGRQFFFRLLFLRFIATWGFFSLLLCCLAENKINRNHINNANIFFHVTGNVSNSNHKYKYRQQRKAWAVFERNSNYVWKTQKKCVRKKRKNLTYTKIIYGDANEWERFKWKQRRLFKKKKRNIWEKKPFIAFECF